MTPNIAVVQIDAPHLHWPAFPIWIPLFLLWIPVLLLSPLILLVVLGLCLAERIQPWRLIAVCWGIVCGLPGTHIRVSTQNSKVLVRIL